MKWLTMVLLMVLNAVAALIWFVVASERSIHNEEGIIAATVVAMIHTITAVIILVLLYNRAKTH